MNSKFKKKIIIVFVLASFFLVLVFNIHKIKFGLSMVNIYKQGKDKGVVSVDDNKDLEVIKPPIENPLENIIESQGKETIEETIEESIEEPNLSEPEPSVVVEEPAPVDNPIKSYMQIVQEYNATLQNLRNKFEEDLNNLISQGITDYRAGTLSKSKLFMKYMSEGSNLEKVSDNQFNEILKKMKKELEDNGHDTSVIDEISDYYDSFKTAKKEDIINRGMEHMN